MQILIAPIAGFEIPKPGTYRARIIEITEHPALNEDWGPQLLIKVQLDQLDSDDNPILLHYYCSQKLSRQSKLGKVVNTVIGKVPGDYSDSNRLNVADLINVPCGVLIEHVERDDGSKRAIISAWLAYEVVDRKRNRLSGRRRTRIPKSMKGMVIQPLLFTAMTLFDVDIADNINDRLFPNNVLGLDSPYLWLVKIGVNVYIHRLYLPSPACLDPRFRRREHNHNLILARPQ